MLHIMGCIILSWGSMVTWLGRTPRQGWPRIQIGWYQFRLGIQLSIHFCKWWQFRFEVGNCSDDGYYPCSPITSGGLHIWLYVHVDHLFHRVLAP